VGPGSRIGACHRRFQLAHASHPQDHSAAARRAIARSQKQGRRETPRPNEKGPPDTMREGNLQFRLPPPMPSHAMVLGFLAVGWFHLLCGPLPAAIAVTALATADLLLHYRHR
jgi:hypothetical protein